MQSDTPSPAAEGRGGRLTKREFAIMHALCGDGPEVQVSGTEINRLSDRGLLSWERRIRARGNSITSQERIRPTVTGKKGFFVIRG